MSLEPEPNTQPDRSIILPILLAVFSLCGILMVFLIGRATASRNIPTVEPSSTPFKYQFIGTEPGISTADLSTEEPFPSSVSNDFATDPFNALPTDAPTETAIALFTPTIRASSTSVVPLGSAVATQVALSPGTYDESHPLISYNGWSILTDNTAYQNTLHLSNIAGSTITFRFTGQQITIKYQTSPSFGVIRINIGGLNFDLDESNGTTEWSSAKLAQGTYTVSITHSAGGSVNIDSIIIPDFNTATPTATVNNLTSTALNQ